MKEWLKSYLRLGQDIEKQSYRKIVISKFIIMSAIIMLCGLMVGNFVHGNINTFLVDFALTLSLSLFILFPGKLREYTPYITIVGMGIGILAVVYLNQGQDFTPVWVFLYIFLLMPLFGHKRGLQISSVFLATILLMLYSFTGSSLSMMEFVRFTMASCFSLLLAFLSEMFISRTFSKLLNTTKQLEKLTKTDALTGLCNRRHFDELLPKHMRVMHRSHGVLALAIIDIDYFKRYNDKFGHPAGDSALISLAKLLNSSMKRANDVVFRLGGEEFALLYQAKSPVAAHNTLEEIRLAVEYLHNDDINLAEKITISAGLFIIDEQSDIAANEVYMLADKLLYSAKSQGRNQVVSSID